MLKLSVLLQAVLTVVVSDTTTITVIPMHMGIAFIAFFRLLGGRL